MPANCCPIKKKNVISEFFTRQLSSNADVLISLRTQKLTTRLSAKQEMTTLVPCVVPTRLVWLLAPLALVQTNVSVESHKSNMTLSEFVSLKDFKSGSSSAYFGSVHR